MTQDRFKGSNFPKCIVLQAIYWYLRYALSYRDIEELMIERGVNIDHSTVHRWVVKYTEMLEEAFRKKKNPSVTAGEWTRHTPSSKVYGIIYTGP